MTFTELFGLFYTKYRGEESPPTSSDPEWEIAVRNYNDALQRLQGFDDTKWNFLWSTLQTSEGGGGVTTLTTGVTDYSCPDDMAEPGGQVTFIDANGNRSNYPVVSPHQVQAINDTTQVAWFTGDQSNEFTMHLNVAPTATENGYSIDYNYYRLPTRLDPDTEDGTSLIEGGDPAFYYLHMAAQRYLDSRNTVAYQAMLRDSEEALKGMKLKNNSGSFYNPWGVSDTGPGFGF